MTDRKTAGGDSFDEEEEITGPAKYLRPGEELLVYSPDVQIKKFRFDAYLTDSRLFSRTRGEGCRRDGEGYPPRVDHR